MSLKYSKRRKALMTLSTSSIDTNRQGHRTWKSPRARCCSARALS